MKVINFYKSQDEYGCFSNFSRHPVIMGRDDIMLTWPTSEHYFQAMKFEDTAIQDEIRMASSPGIAAKMGRDRSKPLRKDWEDIKDGVMVKVVLAKFSQYPELMSILLSTGDAILVEHTENDRYWGDGGDGTGKNMLGKILMAVRETSRLSKEMHDRLDLRRVESDSFQS